MLIDGVSIDESVKDINDSIEIGNLIFNYPDLTGYADFESCSFKTDKYEGEISGKPLNSDGTKNTNITLVYNKLGEENRQTVEIRDKCSIMDYNLSRQVVAEYLIKCDTD